MLLVTHSHFLLLPANADGLTQFDKTDRGCTFLEPVLIFPPPQQGEATRTAAEKAALVENIDAWAMWIAPPIFVFWNLCYWIAYQPWTNKLVSEDTLVGDVHRGSGGWGRGSTK